MKFKDKTAGAKDNMAKAKEKMAALRGKMSKIKYKIAAANVLIIIVPVLVAFFLFGLFFNGPGASYWEIMEQVFHDENGVYSAQSLLMSAGNIDEMEKEMTQAGYHFSVVKDGKEIFSNLTSADITAGEKAAGEMFTSQTDFTVEDGDTVVIKGTYFDEKSDYSVMAIRTAETAQAVKNADEPYIKRYIEWFIGLLVIILLAVVILINLAVNRWISKSVLSPLKQLSLGSERIRSGDLDFSMKTKRRDEIGSVMNDFDEMRQYLKDSVDERLRYESYRKELISGISHDLRTPLTSIKGYVEGLRDGIADTPEKKDKYYSAIEKAIANLEQLSSDLTEFSRLDSGARHFYKEKTELNEFYRSCVKDLEERYRDRSVRISFEGSDGPIYSEIDAGEMNRVHLNIVENSVKYRVKDESALDFRLSREGDSAVIRISDDGPGVREEDLTRIFECFFRSDPSRNHPENGSGIGLAVVKQIVEGHGGTVSAKNDNGFVIEIRLPAAPAPDEESNEQEPKDA
ncbi:MAG: ATP-binding protein [Eubacterium sp.]|jgi:signal transduction histidine kinase